MVNSARGSLQLDHSTEKTILPPNVPVLINLSPELGPVSSCPVCFIKDAQDAEPKLQKLRAQTVNCNFQSAEPELIINYVIFPCLVVKTCNGNICQRAEGSGHNVHVIGDVIINCLKSFLFGHNVECLNSSS